MQTNEPVTIDQELLRECKELAQAQGLKTASSLENTQVHLAADGIVLGLGSWTFESYEERVAFVAQVIDKVFNPAMATIPTAQRELAMPHGAYDGTNIKSAGPNRIEPGTAG